MILMDTNALDAIHYVGSKQVFIRSVIAVMVSSLVERTEVVNQNMSYMYMYYVRVVYEHICTYLNI